MSCADCIAHSGGLLRLYEKMQMGQETPLPLCGSIELTLRCNVRCKHCYILYPGATDDEMNTEEMKAVLKKLADGGMLFLLMTGGEVLARPDFKELYLYAKRDLGMILTIFTNATLVTPDIVDFWKKYPPRKIEVTIYGHTEATYENVTGVKGSFKRFREGCRLMLEAGLPLALKTIAIKSNFHEFKDIRQWVIEQGSKFRYDIDVHPKIDHNVDPLSERLSPQEYVEIELIDLEANFGQYNDYMTNGYNRSSGENLFVCGSGVRTCHVDPQGQLHPCMIWRENPYDLRNKDLSENWREHRSELRGKETKAVGCNSCSNRGVCGRCPAQSLLEMGDPTLSIPFHCETSQERRKLMGEPAPLSIEIV
jgi:radical SAM protein with 4Fe4S-binding SPASM domain